MKYCVIKDYLSPYPDSLSFNRGDTVKVGNEYDGDSDWLGWVWCEGTNGVQAWMPINHLQISGKKGILKRDYNARELSVSTGEELEICEIVGGFGMAENCVGAKGWVPMKVLEKC